MSKLKNTIFKIHQNETKLLILGIFFWKRVKAVNKQKLKKKKNFKLHYFCTEKNY